MGCKTCIEKFFNVQTGSRSFRTGIAGPLIAPFVLLFIGIFFIVIGILLCVLHETYVVARTDQLYSAEPYFLISGLVLLCFGALVVFVSVGWCMWTRRAQAEPIEDYKLRKGFSTNSLNRSRASSFRETDRSYRDQTLSQSEYGSEYKHDQSYQPTGYHVEQDPGFSPPKVDAATRVAQKADQGFNEFRNFMKRNVEASRGPPSPRKKNFSDRMPRPSGGYPDHGRPHEDDFDMDAARQYVQNPAAYYRQNQHEHDDRRGGYEVMPSDQQPQTHRQSGQRPAPLGSRHNGSNSSGAPVGAPGAEIQDPPPGGALPTPLARSSTAYKYEGSRPVLERSPAKDQPGYDPNNSATASNNSASGAGALGLPPGQNEPGYRYDKGRPVPSDRSHDSSLSSMGSSFDADERGVNMAPIPEAVRDTAKLVHNPKDGQWYYYYKGKPISKYDPNKIGVQGGDKGPVYKYIHGRPILLPAPPEPLM